MVRALKNNLMVIKTIGESMQNSTFPDLPRTIGNILKSLRAPATLAVPVLLGSVIAMSSAWAEDHSMHDMHHMHDMQAMDHSQHMKSLSQAGTHCSVESQFREVGGRQWQAGCTARIDGWPPALMVNFISRLAPRSAR
jgi:hypothetical protein